MIFFFNVKFSVGIKDDTLKNTVVGKALLRDYPRVDLAYRIEGHASHAGKHAAGIVIANEPITNYGSVNVRDGVLMMDKRDAEKINLLKIDVLAFFSTKMS